MMDWQEVAIDGETHLKRLVDMYEAVSYTHLRAHET